MDWKEIIRDKTFWIFSVSLAGIIFIVAMNSNRIYEAQIDVLLLPKNEVVVRNMDAVIENARRIAMTLSFYDAVLEKNEDIEDPAMELPSSKRKDYWNSIMDAGKIEESGIVRLTVQGETQSQASMLARQSAESLIVALSRYYNIVSDLEARIADGPIVRQTEKTSVALWLFLSILFGSILGVIFNVAVDLSIRGVGRIFPRKRRAVKKERIVFNSKPSIFPKFSLPQSMKETRFPKAENIFDFKAEEEAALVRGSREKAFMTAGKKAVAPENLPIAEGLSFAVMKEEKPASVPEKKEIGEAEIPNKEEIIEEYLSREATPEEVKERLNKLLGGGMLK